MNISLSKEQLREYLQFFWPSLKHFAPGYEPIIFKDHPSIPEYFMYIRPLCLGNYILFLKEGYVISAEFDMDHFPPQNVGGTLKALVCKACNSKAGHEYDYVTKEFLNELGFHKRIPFSTIETKHTISGVIGRYSGTTGIDKDGKIEFSFKPNPKFKAAFLLMDGYRRFPTDVEFNKELQHKNVYNFRSRNYLLESLENFNRKELVIAENYTIEHVLPQNPNLSDEWKNELGEHWEKVKDKYLHSLGNLSLTGYNSELSDRPFSDKKKIPGGFNSSPLFLNESVREESIWNEKAILTRAYKLADIACKVWERPNLPDDRLEIFKEQEDSREQLADTIDQFDHLHGDMLELYQQLEKRVLNLDSSVKVESKKRYIAFKDQTNFVDVIPQKKRLILSLNIEIEKIKDPKGICKDVSALGRWGNGDVEVSLSNLSELDYVIELIEQAFEEQFETV